MNILILTDNLYALKISIKLQNEYDGVEVFQSPGGGLIDIPFLLIADNIQMVIDKYDIIFSIHCSQIFPEKIIKKVRCINVHPGFNPFNRGWYPHVFSIINRFKTGVTIHEMDEKLDHGSIIVQEECKIDSWDTSESLYLKLIEIEKRLLLSNFEKICSLEYKVITPFSEGNINYKKKFEKLKYIDLNEEGKFGDFINRLRALTHGDFKNGYFIDETGKKVFIKIFLSVEEDDE